MPTSTLASGTDAAAAPTRRARRTRARGPALRPDDRLAAAGFLAAARHLFAVVGPIITRYAYDSEDLDSAVPRAQSRRTGSGTDQYGRDTFTRIVYGARVSLAVGFSAVAGESLVGVAWGTIAGFYGGAVDPALMRVVDLLIGFPTILLAILVTGIFGPTLTTSSIALVLTAWPGMARTIRSEVVSIREREYVDGARVVGASTCRGSSPGTSCRTSCTC